MMSFHLTVEGTKSSKRFIIFYSFYKFTSLILKLSFRHIGTVTQKKSNLKYTHSFLLATIK